MDLASIITKADHGESINTRMHQLCHTTDDKANAIEWKCSVCFGLTDVKSIHNHAVIFHAFDECYMYTCTLV